MNEDRGARKAAMMAEAERLIEKMLDWDEVTKKPTLSDIEEEVLVARKEFGQVAVETLIGGQAEKRPVPGAKCEECGAEMQYKDTKGTTVESRVGEVRVERGYYYCAECKQGFFPPGQTTEIERAALE
jgi:uncharacterized protein with PIN domain